MAAIILLPVSVHLKENNWCIATEKHCILLRECSLITGTLRSLLNVGGVNRGGAFAFFPFLWGDSKPWGIANFLNFPNQAKKRGGQQFFPYSVGGQQFFSIFQIKKRRDSNFSLQRGGIEIFLHFSNAPNIVGDSEFADFFELG